MSPKIIQHISWWTIRHKDSTETTISVTYTPRVTLLTIQFWSNFEIADLRFFRSKVYSDYFDFLDKSGGFFYERWGDAPVHSIAAAFFLPQSQIHFFHDIGYRHSPYIRCPQDESSHLSGRCSCERENNFGTSNIVSVNDRL